MSKRTKKKQAPKKLAKTSLTAADKLPLIEHLKELKRRLFYVAVSVIGGSMIAYGLQQSIIGILLRPSHGQHFIYTSPLGGINFLFSVCLDIGIALSIPLIVYQLLRFLQPLMQQTTHKFIAIGSALSGVIALTGVLFGYFIGLPAALNFLLHQFTSAQIKPLITIQSYMSFVTVYLLGSALMFQLPLILIFINRIKPLKPSRLFHYERHVIVSAFIVGFIMNPTPNLIDQMLVVAPIILMYQVGILLIWFINRDGVRAKFKYLFDQDQALQAERAKLAQQSRPLLEPARTIQATPVVTQSISSRPAQRTRKYVDGFVTRPENYRGFSPDN
ncbi:MAG: twin-arginine translocase subunit TatC [Candidatus Saccharimonadales bacterium]